MRSRGFASWAALSAVLAIGVLMTVALAARTTELGFEDRTLCRVRARWAAESAIARGRAGSADVDGKLDESTTYRLRARAEGGTRYLEGTGTCRTRDHSTSISIEARLTGDRILDWREGIR